MHYRLFIPAFLALSLVACSHKAPQKTVVQNAPQDMVALFNKARQQSFVGEKNAPDSRLLLPPPPAPKSAAFAADVSAYQQGLKQRQTARGKHAIEDAHIDGDTVNRVFAKAFGMGITPQKTPQTYALMTRIMFDLGASATDKAKKYYKRPRPFMVFNATSCAPAQEAMLRKDGSYPSGHTALGWGWALILAEISPERQNAILKRGYEFGQSRVICGAHWQSDVDAGRLVAAAMVAKLHANKDFEQKLRQSKAEIARLRQK